MTSLWRSPSGVHHWLRHCSAGSVRLAVRVNVSDIVLAEMSWPNNGLCRCALRARDKAIERLKERT